MNQPGFFVTGGALQVDAGSYVSRGADEELLAALRAGEFCYVLTTRQMGKSSLMVRTASQLREGGASVVIIDLTAIGQNLDVEQWYFSMLCHVGERLELEAEMEAYWDANIRRAPLQRFMGALREVCLEQRSEPLVIFVDEIDAVRSLRQFSADEFFAGIRECYNRRPEDAKMRRLSFCLLGVATPSDLISDQRMTPFNIGHAIHLGDFTDADARVLANGLSPVPDTANTLIARVLWWTSGQPFLTQKLCAEVAKARPNSPKEVDEACARIFLSPDARERDDNLHFVRDRLLRSELDRAALLDTYARVCRGERMADDHLNPVVAELRLSGVVRVVDGHLKLRNRIYSQVFDLQWVRANMPGNEIRRQRAAFYRGARRVAGVAAVVLAIMGWLVLNARRSAEEAKVATQQAQRSAESEKLARKEAEDQSKRAEREVRRATAESQRATDEAKKRVEAAEGEKKARVEAAEGEKKANEELLREAGKTKAALNLLVGTQSKVEALLEALTPLVSDKSGKLILERAEEVVRSVASESADDPRVVLGLAGLRRVCGRLYLRLGSDDIALNQAQEARRLVEAELKRGTAGDPGLNKQLHDCLILIGDAILGGRTPDTEKRKTESDYMRAIATYREALELSKAENAARVDDATWRGLYFADLINLGDTARLFEGSKDMDAQAFYREALEEVNDFRKRSPGTASLNLIEASIRDRLGTLFLGMNRRTDAREEFERSLAMRKSGAGEGVAEDPERQSDLATSYNKRGNLFIHEKRWKEALACYEPSLAIRRKLCLESNRLDWRRDLGFTLNNTAKTLLNLGENQRAHDLGLERLKLAETWHSEDPGDPLLKLDHNNAIGFYAHLLLNVPDKALQDWPRALVLAQQAARDTERRDPRFLALLAQALRCADRASEAIAAADEADKLLPPKEKRTAEEKIVATEIAFVTGRAKAELKKGN